jgi:death-on-curing protein
MTRYLTPEQVMALHADNMQPDLLGDYGLLASGVHRCQTTLFGEDAYPDLAAKGAALFHSLATTQSFIDGNKRIAVLALVAFLNLNLFEITLDDGDMYHLALDTANGQMDVPKIAELIRGAIRRINLGGVSLD